MNKKVVPTIGTPVLRSKEQETSVGGAPARIVLTKMPEEDAANWATHQTNEESGGAFWGHYKTILEYAIKDYIERCREIGINPEPELLDEEFDHVAREVRLAMGPATEIRTFEQLKSHVLDSLEEAQELYCAGAVEEAGGELGVAKMFIMKARDRIELGGEGSL